MNKSQAGAPRRCLFGWRKHCAAGSGVHSSLNKCQTPLGKCQIQTDSCTTEGCSTGRTPFSRNVLDSDGGQTAGRLGTAWPHLFSGRRKRDTPGSGLSGFPLGSQRRRAAFLASQKLASQKIGFSKSPCKQSIILVEATSGIEPEYTVLQPFRKPKPNPLALTNYFPRTSKTIGTQGKRVDVNGIFRQRSADRDSAKH
jgi:hypothetical protein